MKFVKSGYSGRLLFKEWEKHDSINMVYIAHITSPKMQMAIIRELQIMQDEWFGWNYNQIDDLIGYFKLSIELSNRYLMPIR